MIQSYYTNCENINFVDSIDLIDISKEYIEVHFFETTGARPYKCDAKLEYHTEFYIIIHKGQQTVQSVEVNHKSILFKKKFHKNWIVVIKDSTKQSEFEIQRDRVIDSITEILNS